MGLRKSLGLSNEQLWPEGVGRDVAVIDVGSNSVRLVQFRVEGRALWTVFNEKTMAGLGRGAAQTGRLNPDGVEIAIRTLKRFAQLLNDKGVMDCRVVATAAVRACEDGADFIARVLAETGLRIEVLSGEDEGRYSSLGVLAGIGEATGWCGDLGGSSLELTALNGRHIGQAVSLPVGPLALNVSHANPEKLARKVSNHFDAAFDAMERSKGAFYAVGGAWRAFANLSMAIRDYPLRLLHQYTLDADEVFEIARFAMRQSERSLASIPGVAAKRAATLPHAAFLLDQLMRKGRFEQVVFSAYGLREGVVCMGDPSLVKDGDPLISGAEAMAKAVSTEPAFGPVLADWLEPAFTKQDVIFTQSRDAVLRAAAARLCDIGARLHPDHRGYLAFTQVLYAPIGGQSHRERVFLALALHHRYEGKAARPDNCPSRRLLTEAQCDAAMKLGLGLRLGAALSGRTASLLNRFKLARKATNLVITPDMGAEDLIVERAWRRFEQFSTVMGLAPKRG